MAWSDLSRIFHNLSQIDRQTLAEISFVIFRSGGDNIIVGYFPTAERRRIMDFKRDESLQKRKNTGYSDTARIMRRALGVTAMRGSDFDPDGSYTGVCDNIYEKPVQDADDL